MWESAFLLKYSAFSSPGKLLARWRYLEKTAVAPKLRRDLNGLLSWIRPKSLEVLRDYPGYQLKESTVAVFKNLEDSNDKGRALGRSMHWWRKNIERGNSWILLFRFKLRTWWRYVCYTFSKWWVAWSSCMVWLVLSESAHKWCSRSLWWQDWWNDLSVHWPLVGQR